MICETQQSLARRTGSRLCWKRLVDFSAAMSSRLTGSSKHELKGDGAFENAQSYRSTPQNEMEPDETSPLSSIGSLGAIDRVDEDHNRSEHTRATGYMGKSSEITWMQRLQREAEQRARGKCGALESEGDEDDETKDRFSLSALNYHLDDLSISVPEPIQKFTMPPRHLADRLFDDYLKTVHPFFPIISKTLFCAQYQTFFDNSARSNSVRPGDKWLAILNVIFAIAAKHAHLMNSPWRGAANDHLMYLARARLLSMNTEVLFAHPDLQQVQVEGLIAFYLLASDQINRFATEPFSSCGGSALINCTGPGEYQLWQCVLPLPSVST